MAERALVTGGAGLLGRVLVRLLLESGDAVRSIDLVQDPHRPPEVEELRGDLCDPALAVRACQGIDVVYHLAAAQRMKPQFRGLSEQQIFDNNLRCTRTTLEGALRCSARKAVVISSSAVYGVPPAEPVTEQAAQSAIGAYGRSKQEIERIALEFLPRGLDVTLLRPMSIFGPGMSGVFVLLFDWVRRSKRVYLFGRGSNRVQLVDARDLARAAIAAAGCRAAAGQVFNIGSERVGSVRETVRALIEQVGSRSGVVGLPAAPARLAARLLDQVGCSPLVPEHYLLADRDFILDISSARAMLGWTPEYDNVRMMVDAYHDYSAGPLRNGGPQSHPLVKLINRLS